MSEIKSYEQFQKKFTFSDEPNYYVYCFSKCADVQQCFNADWQTLTESEDSRHGDMPKSNQRAMLKKLFNENAHAASKNVNLETCFDGGTTKNVKLTMFMRHKNIDQYSVDEIPNWQTLLSKMQIVKTNMMPGKKPQSYGGKWFDEYVEEMYNVMKEKKFLKPSTKSRNPFAKKGPVTTFADYLESKKIKEGDRDDILDIGINSQDGISKLARATAWGKRDVGNGWRYEKKLARPTNWQAIDAAKLEYAKEFPNNSDVKELSRYSDFEELFSTEPEEEETAEVEDIKLEEPEKTAIETAEPVTGTETATAIATKVGTEEEAPEEEIKTAPVPVPAQVPAAKTGTGSSTKVNFNLGSSSIAEATGNRNPISGGSSAAIGIIGIILDMLKIKGGNKSRRRNKKTRKSRKQQKSRRANKK
jgi:hypothetical protein